MIAARTTWFLCFLLLCSLLSLPGCALRNRQQAGRDLTYTANITISPRADLTGARLPSVPGLLTNLEGR